MCLSQGGLAGGAGTLPGPDSDAARAEGDAGNPPVPAGGSPRGPASAETPQESLEALHKQVGPTDAPFVKCKLKMEA